MCFHQKTVSGQPWIVRPAIRTRLLELLARPSGLLTEFSDSPPAFLLAEKLVMLVKNNYSSDHPFAMNMGCGCSFSFRLSFMCLLPLLFLFRSVYLCRSKLCHTSLPPRQTRLTHTQLKTEVCAVLCMDNPKVVILGPGSEAQVTGRMCAVTFHPIRSRDRVRDRLLRPPPPPPHPSLRTWVLLGCL